MAAPYIGNQDYRGYLNYMSKNSKGPTAVQAGSLLKYGVGNDAGFSSTGALSQDLLNRNSQFYSDYTKANSKNSGGYNASADILKLLAGAQQAAVAPNWDINSIYKQSGSAAAKQVNPYYTKQLKAFQSGQAKAKALQDQQRQLTLQGLTDSYNETLQSNQLTGERTADDVLLNQQQIGMAADQRQMDQGMQFDDARIEQAKQLAQGGLTGDGMGGQQVLESQTARNVQEGRQGEQDVQAVAQQELVKARTFEDIGRSNVLAGGAKAKGEKQTKIDWDKFIHGQGEDLREYKDTSEKQRLERLSSVQGKITQTKINSMIRNIANPAQRAAAAQAYGGRF
jgi:hypothetical protein